VLSRFIEEQGVPTAGISLIRPHTETIKPPRALWVPFELGHPLGAPDDSAFQRKVLLALLKLLEAPEGPVLEDFPEDEPENNEITKLAYPANFTQSISESNEADSIQAALRKEMTAIRPWYDMAVAKRKRTTVGVSGIDLDKLGNFIFTFVKGEESENPRNDIPLAYALKLAAEDLKSYYVEGITSQPEQAGASSQVLKDWFWDDTVAGKVLLMLKKVCEESEDETMRMIGSHFIVPGDVARRQKN
jgi:hypothetical protein